MSADRYRASRDDHTVRQLLHFAADPEYRDGADQIQWSCFYDLLGFPNSEAARNFYARMSRHYGTANPERLHELYFGEQLDAESGGVGFHDDRAADHTDDGGEGNSEDAGGDYGYSPPREQIEMGEEGNTVTAESNSRRIKTLEQLIEAAEIDLNTYEVERWVANKWEVGAKNDNKEIVVEPLWQVKAWLKRKEPVRQAFPALRPIQAKIPLRSGRSSQRRNGLRRALVIPDSQNGYVRDFETGELDPFHNRLCWDIAVQMAREIYPNEIILLGDMLDLPDWSDKFLRSPEMYWTTQPAIDELHWWLTQLRLAAPDSDIYYLEGNHEDRLNRAVMANLKAAYHLKPADQADRPEMLSIPNLLGLESLEIEWVGDYPDGKVWLNDNVFAEHGDKAKKNPGHTAGDMVDEARASVLFGHVHRAEQASKTVFARRGAISYTAMTPGTFARIPGPTPARSKENNWQNGLCVVDYESGNGRFGISPALINQGAMVWNGRIYEGQDHTDEIRQEFDWPFVSAS